MIGRSGRRRSAAAGTPVSGLAPGCLFATVSTLATCLLLFVNGGLVAAICSAASRSGVSILSNTGVHQFFLFVGPVVLVVIQWMMIDYVTSRIRRRPS